MKSMTGFGKGSAECDGTVVRVEASSVNRKQQDIRIVLPRELGSIEASLRQVVQQQISRGCVSVYVSYEVGARHRLSQVRIDEELAVHTATKLRDVAARAGIRADVTMADVLAVPGVLVDESTNLPMQEIEELALKALNAAMSGLEETRTEEGKALVADIASRFSGMSEAVASMRQGAHEAVELYRDRLLDRVRKLGLELTAEDERLAKEVVFFAERADVTEELVRLESHISQTLELLKSTDDVGRNLDFLCQEMHREVNTLAAKTSETTIADLALVCKAELARIREQAMNIE